MQDAHNVKSVNLEENSFKFTRVIVSRNLRIDCSNDNNVKIKIWMLQQYNTGKHSELPFCSWNKMSTGLSVFLFGR